MRCTALVLVALAVALTAYDVAACLWLPAGSTLSEVVLAGSRRYPALPFAAGFVCGHLFWPQRGRR